MKIKIKHILGGAILMSALFLGSGLFAADSIFTFAELFTNTDYRDAGNTTADWVNGTFDGLVRLPKDSTAGSASKQVNGKVLRASDGNLYYAWVDFRSGIGDGKGHVYIQSYDTSGTKRWSNDMQVDSASADSVFLSDDFLDTVPGLVESNGFIFVYWVLNGNLWVQKFNAAGAKQWSGDTRINAATVSVTAYNFGYTPAVVDSTGLLVFFWDSGSGLYMQKFDGSGSSGGSMSGSLVELLHAYIDNPVAGRDSSDNFYVAYSSYDYTTFKKVLNLDKFNSSGSKTWTQQVANSTSINSADIATDSSGNSYVVWDDNRNSSSTGRDVFIQMYTSGGAKQWGSTGVQINTDAGWSIQQNPKVKLDSNNLPNVIWEDQRSGTTVDIYAQRYNASGTAQWSGEKLVNKGTNGSAYAEYFVGIGNSFSINTAAGADQNSLYVAWFTDRSNDYNIYGQKVNSAGTVGWGTDLQVTTEKGGGGFIGTAQVQSKTIDGTPQNITGARVFGIYLTNGQDIKFYVSHDGGNTWIATDMLGTKANFTGSGSDLRWKAVFTSTDPFQTPVIYALVIEYYIQGAGDPYHKVLHVYDDNWEYPPAGWMAENNRTDALTMSSNSADSPAEGSACVKLTYNPNIASWVGFYAQASGKWRDNGGAGIDLSSYSQLVIKARAADTNTQAIQVQFGIGENGDSFSGTTNWSVLPTTWTTYVIDLAGKNLTDINGLVMVNLRRVRNIDPVIYIDDIKFIGPGPANITDLRPTMGNAAGAVTLNWTAPAGDYTNTSYIVKYADTFITSQADFNAAHTFTQSWTPATAGTAESRVVTGLVPGHSYYFAIETTDANGNQSGLSNVVYYMARTSGLGISVSGLINLGDIYAGNTASGGPITVTNIGGVTATLSLDLDDPPGWFASLDNDTINHYVMMGAFATIISNISWDVNNHALTTTTTKCSDLKFAGDQTGVNIELDGVRKMWIRFVSPKTMSPGTGNQTIYINFTVERGI